MPNVDSAPTTSLLTGRSRRPLHGKWTVVALGMSVVLNAMLILYSANSAFMRPLEYDREKELGILEQEDRRLTAQTLRLEATTKNLELQKKQLQKHYKETEDVGKKLEMYKAKLGEDAVEVTNAENAAEILMQRLAKAQGTTIAAKGQLKREKEKLEQAKLELAKVEEEMQTIQRNQKTDALIRAMSRGADAEQLSAQERADLCHACTCVAYC
mmetsp:Transcript_24791/g.60847  ORF Transcript_24791/g.60847 Transcript_24791/m.60847 type:complete len:213 (+) Transcript_24791:136-774(+)